ncbi:hypothetical protein CCS92_32725, partial [Methylobacterium radiotolerans]
MLPYDAKEYGRHNLGDVSRPETRAAGPQRAEERRVGKEGEDTVQDGLSAIQPRPRHTHSKRLSRIKKQHSKKNNQTRHNHETRP